MDVIEAMETCGAARYLRPDPVPQDLVERVIYAAIRASSPGSGPSVLTEPLRGLHFHDNCEDFDRFADNVIKYPYLIHSEPKLWLAQTLSCLIRLRLTYSRVDRAVSEQRGDVSRMA